jgi:hypothetical protein
MADDDKKELTMEIHPEALVDLERLAQDDPEGAAAIREMLANMRQAVAGVNAGQYKSFEEGIEAITGQLPRKFSEYDEEDEDDEDQ